MGADIRRAVMSVRQLPGLLLRRLRIFRAGRRSPPWELALPLLASLAFSAVFIARSSFTAGGQRTFSLFDDAMISMTYARNLAEGNGLVWNVGQSPVEGYTNFLWTVVMTLVHVGGFSDRTSSLAVMVLGAGLMAANVIAVYAIARRVAPASGLVAFVAAGLCALLYPLGYWTLRGMEVGLLALLVSGMVLQALRLRERPTGRDLSVLAALMAIAVLVRDDAVIPALAIGAWTVASVPAAGRRRVGLILGGAVAATLAAHTAFRLAYYGEPLPNTYYLKVTGIGMDVRLRRGALAVANIGVLQLFAPVALAAAALASRRRDLGWPLILLVTPFVATVAYVIYVGGDAWEWMQIANRYLTPALPPLLVAAVLGAEALIKPATRRPASLTAAAVLAAWLLAALLPLGSEHSWLQFSSATSTLRRTFPIVVVLGLVMALWVAAPLLGRGPRWRAAALLAVGVVMLGAVSGQSASRWLRSGAIQADDDAEWSRYGLALRAATPRRTTIAVTLAGAIPYFSHRRSVDLLGKSDPMIAHEPPRTDRFQPGHNKWDTKWSVGRLRPDFIAQFRLRDPADEALLAREGYLRVPELEARIRPPYLVLTRRGGIAAEPLAARLAANGVGVRTGR